LSNGSQKSFNLIYFTVKYMYRSIYFFLKYIRYLMGVGKSHRVHDTCK